jgi:hypothetical protein
VTLFLDKKRHEYLLRIVGKSNFEYFQRAGLDQMEVPTESMQEIAELVQGNPDISDNDLSNMYTSAEVPKFPVLTNPGVKNPEMQEYKAKMEIAETGDAAEVSLLPEDLEGTYDYVPDVKSMAMGAEQEQAQAIQKAIELLTSNPTVLQLMQAEGYKPKIKELLEETLEVVGLRDASRFFDSTGNGLMPGATPGMGEQGLPGIPNALPQGGVSHPQWRQTLPYATNH